MVNPGADDPATKADDPVAEKAKGNSPSADNPSAPDDAPGHDTSMLEPDASAPGLEVAPGLELIEAPVAPPTWSSHPPPIVPQMPVLAMADDEESENKVVLRSKNEEAEMDMTPMVDVTFQLLIFFMLTTTFALQKSLQIPKPQPEVSAAGVKSNQERDEDASVTVRVEPSGTFMIESSHFDGETIEAPSEQELLSRLRQTRAGATPASRMMVIAHGDALHERVVMAIDAGVHVGMEQVLFSSTDDNN